jgi:drug/metabolite transporter (DMT)-like permease
MKPANTAETQALFTPLDWLLSIGMALTWGSSFLLIKIAIRHFDSSVIPLGRTAFGAAALLLIPSARKHIAREHWPRLLALGFVWMAFPFLLYPLAEESVSSAITGMMNGGLPVVVTVVTAIWIRNVPSPRRILAVLVGFSGIAMIAVPSIREGSTADAKGISLLLLALLSYRPFTAPRRSCFTLNWLLLRCLFPMDCGEFRNPHLHGPRSALWHYSAYLAQGSHLFCLRYLLNEPERCEA